MSEVVWIVLNSELENTGYSEVIRSAAQWTVGGVLVHYLADEQWSGSVTETSLPKFPFFSPVSGWPEGTSGRPRPNADRSMLGADEETSHANDVDFDAGRSGAVGDSG
jgi:hypothetical protein